MIARVTSLQAKVGHVDEVKKYFDEVVLPAAKVKKGFHSGYLVINRKTGNCLSIAFWDTEADALADEKDGSYQKRANGAKELVVKLTTREIYEVASKYP